VERVWVWVRDGIGDGFGDRSSGTWRYGELGDRIDSTQMSDCDKGIE